MTTEPTKKVYLTQDEFNKDLEICLTIVDKCDDYYVCEYISAALYKSIIHIHIK
jgi:hypothetical protein